MDNSRVYFTTKQLLSGVRTKFHFENDDSVQPLIDSLHRRNYDVMLDLIDVRPPLQLLQRQRSTVQQQEGSIVLQQTLTVERDLLASCVARLQDVIRFLESPPRMRGMVDDLDDKGEMDRAMTIRESSANTSGSIATTTVAAVVATPIPPVPHLPQPALPLLPPLTADISILTTTHLGYTLLESALDALVELSFRCPLGALLDPHIQRVLYPAGRTRGALQSVTMAGLMLTRHRLSNFLGLYRNCENN